MAAFHRGKGRERGMVLVTTLVIGCLVSIVVGALLVVIQQQNTLVARSRAWCSEIPIAEAGIEEAMAHLNSSESNLAANGWTQVGSEYVKKRMIGDGYFYTAISSGASLTIVSVGYGRIPFQSNFTKRTVMVTARRESPGFGVVAKGPIKMNGGGYIDSFDSSDPAYSSNGLYTISKRSDQALVGTLSSDKPAINTGSGYIYGKAATGPGGTVVGTVGDGSWISDPANNGTVRSGYAANDFNMAIPDVSVPFTGGNLVPAWPSSKTVTLTGDYKHTGNFSINGGEKLLVAGNVRLHVTGDFMTSGFGSVEILPGGSLELYIGGKAVIAGVGVVNGMQSAAQCAIYGLPTCTSIAYNGSAGFIGQVYAPQAAFTFNGNDDASGSFTANSIVINGSVGIHFDQALGRPAGPYKIVAWSEL
jgi:hypothetical protein